MVELWSAFLIGLVGSLHCAGMCGALALALPAGGSGGASFLAGRTAYNLGRITSYGVLGLAVGLIGRSLAIAGLQRWVSLAAGLGILISLAFSTRYGLGQPAVRAVAFLKSGFSVLLRRRTLGASFLLGCCNGLLPCGLVYVACAGAVAMGGCLSAVAYMLAFGLGTLPMMLGIGVLGRNVQLAIRLRFQWLIPLCMVGLAALLLLRGMALGIPYLSPDLSALGGAHACH